LAASKSASALDSDRSLFVIIDPSSTLSSGPLLF
jgi:hypothetical protein